VTSREAPWSALSGFARRFGNELLLNSGQYALFYILMNFSASGLNYFHNFGHTALLFILIIQTSVLVLFGGTPGRRFFFSLIAPAVYSLIELREGLVFVLNMGHMFFWFSSIVTGFLQAAILSASENRSKQVLEFVLTGVNVAIFMIVYFYFDAQLALQDQVAAGTLTTAKMNAQLELSQFWPAFVTFLEDPAHLYVLSGGAVLALTLGIGRVKILQLSARITELFGQYVDKSVRDRILSRSSEAISEFREVAVLFSDIRNFTSISEHEPPRQITSMLNEYFSWWDHEVRTHGGIIDKYIGDAVMVVFGLQNQHNSCESAVNCALAMNHSFRDLQDSLQAAGLPVIGGFGVGINFGEVIVGDIGSRERRNFTVIGDAVNVASRLESATKQLGSNLVISQTTFDRLPSQLQGQFERQGKAALKGRKDTLLVYAYRTGQ